MSLNFHSGFEKNEVLMIVADLERFQAFVEAIFYVGKGAQQSRPLTHLKLKVGVQ